MDNQNKTPAVDPQPESQAVRPSAQPPAPSEKARKGDQAVQQIIERVGDYSRFMGYKTETGLHWPEVNLAGVDYPRPGNTIGLGRPYFAVLSGNNAIDRPMIDRLKEHVSVNLKPETAVSEPSPEPAPLNPALSIRPQGDDSPDVSNPRDPKRK
jgi:hypothetical protein